VTPGSEACRTPANNGPTKFDGHYLAVLHRVVRKYASAVQLVSADLDTHVTDRNPGAADRGAHPRDNHEPGVDAGPRPPQPPCLTVACPWAKLANPRRLNAIRGLLAVLPCHPIAV